VAVKRSQSASRAFSVFELIATHQPIGLTHIAKQLGADRSAVQRALATLADSGWIKPSPIAPNRWELSPRVFAVANLPHSAVDLRQRARPVLEHLRDAFGETAFLSIPDAERFVIIDVQESPHPLRAFMRVAELTPVRGSATGRAVLPYLSLEKQIVVLGGAPTEADLVQFAAARARGYGLSVGEIQPGSTSVAAAIFDGDGEPIAALGLSGHAERFTPARHATAGALVVQGARTLSRNAREWLRGGAASAGADASGG
jgi:DNA-binding IclR family transcriptional regulator